jgi:hypothetical protein
MHDELSSHAPEYQSVFQRPNREQRTRSAAMLLGCDRSQAG